MLHTKGLIVSFYIKNIHTQNIFLWFNLKSLYYFKCRGFFFLLAKADREKKKSISTDEALNQQLIDQCQPIRALDCVDKAFLKVAVVLMKSLKRSSHHSSFTPASDATQTSSQSHAGSLPYAWKRNTTTTT